MRAVCSASNTKMLGSVRPGERTASPQSLGSVTQALCVHVDDLDAHFDRARSAGADIISPLIDTDLGFREYHARDIEGHPWTFTNYLPDAGPSW